MILENSIQWTSKRDTPSSVLHSKPLGWFVVLFLLAILLPAQAQTSSIPNMLKIEADCFTMGSEEFVVEEPEHKVCLNSYYLMVHKVTQKQFESVTGENPSRFKGLDLSVENVSWPEADTYCRSFGGRLPTEAEWEKARRGPAENPSASRPQETARTSLPIKAGAFAVDSPPANGYGIHHLAGNVWEWVNDWHDESYYRTSPAENPLGPLKGLRKSVRGGSWYNNVWYTKPGMRFQLAPHVKLNSLGFRCARSANGSNN
mgnify:CR=1 FL=1